MRIRNIRETARTAALGHIDLEFWTGQEWLPFTLCPNTTGGIGRAIMAEINRQRAAGVLEIIPFTPQDVPTEADMLAAWRSQAICSRFQAREALRDAGLFDDAETAIAGTDARTQNAWNEAIEFRRLSPTINAISSAMGLTDEQVDDLFRAASQIEV